MRSEAELEKAVVNHVKAAGGLALKLILLNLRGFPDRTLIFPGGRIGFLELKHPSGCGRVSRNQGRWCRTLESFGFRVMITHDFEEAKQFTEEIKNG